ncbi:MAG: BrnA antitoxin family protein [Chromatiaceae bacterium]|nr:BrnA antitoxin family protein [Chromatiaceae bacterium]
MCDEDDFTNSQRGAIVKSHKERITIRLDPDIIEWFRGRVRGGGNDQTHVRNAWRSLDRYTLRRSPHNCAITWTFSLNGGGSWADHEAAPATQLAQLGSERRRD